MTYRSFHLSALAAGVAVLALMAPVSLAQEQAPNAQKRNPQIRRHGAAGAATHLMTAPATHGATMQRGQPGAENRTVNTRQTVTNRHVATTSRFGTTYGGTTVAGGAVGGGSYGGGGYYAGGYGHQHGCWWYRHYGPDNIPRWCATGYAAPSSGYSYGYGYTSGPSRFGTTTRVNRQFASNRQTTVTRRTNVMTDHQANVTANRQAHTTASPSAHGGTRVEHGGASVARMSGHNPRQQPTH